MIRGQNISSSEQKVLDRKKFKILFGKTLEKNQKGILLKLENFMEVSQDEKRSIVFAVFVDLIRNFIKDKARADYLRAAKCSNYPKKHKSKASVIIARKTKEVHFHASLEK
jgi:hypothetical protein